MKQSLSSSCLIVVVVFFCCVISVAAFGTVHAQHLIRSRHAFATSLVTLVPIGGVEILPLNSTASSVTPSPNPLSEFTLPTSALVHSISFLFDPNLPQLPFTCGTARARCHSVKCYITCANTTYSVALRCNDVAAATTADSSQSAWRIAAIAQRDLYEETIDDQFSVTLAVQQRMAAGTRCHFAFAHDLMGRSGMVPGRLRGSVAITVQRSLPFGSGRQFHPPPSLWNNTGSSVGARSIFPWGADALSGGGGGAAAVYVRCTTTGDVTLLVDPSLSGDSSSSSNWTSACCYSDATRAGDCTVSYSRLPSFFDATRRRAVFARVNSKLNSSAGLDDGTDAPCRIANAAATASTLDAAASRVLRVNLTDARQPNFLSATVLGRSLLQITRLSALAPTTTTSNAAIGMFLCEDDDSSAARQHHMCLLHVANASIVIFPKFASPVESSSPDFTPLCESLRMEQSPLGPFDDASSVQAVLSSSGSSLALQVKVPRGPCYSFSDLTSSSSSSSSSSSKTVDEKRIECSPPCTWSDTLGVCLWGDTIAPTAAYFGNNNNKNNNILHRSAPCSWPTPNASSASAPDGRCRTSQSELPLSALLAHLCLKRGFTSAAIAWCVQSAFSCAYSPDVIAERLLTTFCNAAAAASASSSGSSSSAALVPRDACADPSLSCLPNGTAAVPPTKAQIILNVLTNRSTVVLVSAAKGELLAEPLRDEGGIHPAFLSVLVELVAKGASFNLTAIRNDLAAPDHPGFVTTVPSLSSNLGRFSIQSKFRDLFPDANYAITDVLGNLRNTSLELSTTLVLRIAKTAAFQPLPGTTQYLDIIPPGASAAPASAPSPAHSPSSSSSSSSSSISATTLSTSGATATTTASTNYRSPSWMVPADFTFQRIRFAFSAPPLTEDELCSSTGLAAAAILFGLMSGLGAWINVAAVQATLLGAQSTCAPEPVRRCFVHTLGLVSPAKWLWSDDGVIKTASETTTSTSSSSSSSHTASGGSSGGTTEIRVSTDLDRKAFWTQFVVIFVALLVHLALVRGYQYCAPLRGSVEETLWWPAPAFYLCGLLALGTVQTAWVVIFDDEQTALRVLSFFSFATLVGVILPWWFVKLFRAEENFFKRYDISSVLQNVQGAYGRGGGGRGGRDGNNESAVVEMFQQQQQQQHQEQASKSGGRGKRRRNPSTPKSPAQQQAVTNTSFSSSLQLSPSASASKLIAATASISLNHRDELAARRKAAHDRWLSSSAGERCTFRLFWFIVPSGSWPHTRGLAPARDLLHPKGCYFSWVSLLVAGFAGLNFAYVGVDMELCQANYANMAVLQFIWGAFAVYWRPFRVPALTVLWVLARLMDFGESLLSVQWVMNNLPHTERALHIRAMKNASLCFMLVFSIVTFVVKIRELLGALAQTSGAEVERKRDEKKLDLQLMMNVVAENNNNNNNNTNNNHAASSPLSASLPFPLAERGHGLSSQFSLSSPTTKTTTTTTTTTLTAGGSMFGNDISSSSPLFDQSKRPPPMSYSAHIDETFGVAALAPLRAPTPVSARGNAATAAAAAAASFSLSPSPARARSVSFAESGSRGGSRTQPTRKIVVRWEDHYPGDDDDEDDDLDDSSTLIVNTAQRSQRTANLLSSFGTLLRVQELSSALTGEEKKVKANSDFDSEDDEEEEEGEGEEEDQAVVVNKKKKKKQQHHNPIRLLATFEETRDAIAALQALNGRVMNNTRITCDFLSDEEEERQRKEHESEEKKKKRQRAAAEEAKSLSSRMGRIFQHMFVEL